MVGSALFALGSAPLLSTVLGAHTSNILFVVGAWFFTVAGLIQLVLSGAIFSPLPNGPRRKFRADWLTAATQSVGTVLFNASTTFALIFETTQARDKFVWSPDAFGSTAFLISGAFACAAYSGVGGSLFAFGQRDWWSVVINFVGCVAFGISAVAAFVLSNGNSLSTSVASTGTFVGALCFFLASLIVLPQRNGRRPAPADVLIQ
jgi:hypothetical protein